MRQYQFLDKTNNTTVYYQPAEGDLRGDDLVMELRKRTQTTATSSVSDFHQKRTCCNTARTSTPQHN